MMDLPVETAPESAGGLTLALDAHTHLPTAEQAQAPDPTLTRQRPAEMQILGSKVCGRTPPPAPLRGGVTVNPELTLPGLRARAQRQVSLELPGCS